jgi:hypothetical protein
MHSTQASSFTSEAALPNGYGAAALLSAGIGSCALAVISIAADRMSGFRQFMTFYRPTGPLSGVTTSAILVWLIAWSILHLRWRKRNVRLRWVGTAAILLVVLSVLLTFPPIADIF